MISSMPVSSATTAGELFAGYYAPILRYILRIVRDRSQADDLTQETFLRAHRRGDSIRDPDAVVGWLYRIATNVCVDHFRSRRPVASLDDSKTYFSPPQSRNLGADEIAERAETSRCVQRCLEHLPDNYRAVLLLFETKSLTAVEIAAVLGVNVTTVKMRLHRARNLLRAIMRCGCDIGSDSKGLPTCQPKSRQ